MMFDNYVSISLRDSAVDGGPSGQESSVTLPETVSEMWVVTNKTAENNADNLLTVRIQASIGGTWVDVPARFQATVATTAATDVALAALTPNVVDGSSSALASWLCTLPNLPSNIVRAIWVSSGTGTGGADLGNMNTFSVTAYYRLYEFGS